MAGKAKKIDGKAENWENGKLGRDANYVRRSSDEDQAAMQAALGMKPISIRLPVDLIDALKAIADQHGIGYQPMIRDILQRFALAEMKSIFRELQQKVDQRSLLEDSPAEGYFDDEEDPEVATG